MVPPEWKGDLGGPTPYLGLRARLSQIWINRWTVLLALVLVRLLFAVSSVHEGLRSAHREAMAACRSVESIGSAMASMPHYMAHGVNELVSMGVESSVRGLFSSVGLGISAAEEMIVFFIGLLTNTYLCLITFAVTGSLHAVINLVESVNRLVEANFSSLSAKLSSSVGEFDKLLHTFLDKIQGLPLIGNTVADLPKLDLQRLSEEIRKFRITDATNPLRGELTKLNSSLPTFGDVKNFTESVLRAPFSLLRQEVEHALSDYHFNLADIRIVVPVDKESLQFCTTEGGGDDINTFFDRLNGLTDSIRRWFVTLLVLGSILVCVPVVYAELYRWRHLAQRASLIRNIFNGGSGEEKGKRTVINTGYTFSSQRYENVAALDAIYVASHPHSASVGLWLACKAGSRRSQTLLRWIVAYAFSPAALFLLSLGAAGLVASLCQLFLLRGLQGSVPELTGSIDAFTNRVGNTLNEASMAWSQATNHAIQAEGDRINERLFGWVSKAGGSVNSTLDTFVEQSEKALHTLFDGSILAEPVREVYACLVGLKLQGIQKAITWVHDHAHVTLPLIPEQVFSLSAMSSNFDAYIAKPAISSSPEITGQSLQDSRLTNGTTFTVWRESDPVSRILTGMVQRYRESVHTEIYISLVMFGVWAIIAMLAILRAIMLYMMNDRLAGRLPDYSLPANVAGGGDGGASHRSSLTLASTPTPTPILASVNNTSRVNEPTRGQVEPWRCRERELHSRASSLRMMPPPPVYQRDVDQQNCLVTSTTSAKNPSPTITCYAKPPDTALLYDYDYERQFFSPLHYSCHGEKSSQVDPAVSSPLSIDFRNGPARTRPVLQFSQPRQSLRAASASVAS